MEGEVPESAMSILKTLPPEPPPLQIDEDGAIRIANSRVTLDTIVAAFEGGSSPEEIVRKFPTLERADVYGAIAYCLRNPDAIVSYLDRRGKEAEGLRRNIEELCPPETIRERLTSRRSGKR
jgi:uncharacterized protein (DUF433 family)